MNREETIKILALIKVAYPTAYKDMSKDIKLATVNMWHSSFESVPYSIMEFAFDKYRKENKFAPTVAEMYGQLRDMYYLALEKAIDAQNAGNRELKEQYAYVMSHTYDYIGHSMPGGCPKLQKNLIT